MPAQESTIKSATKAIHDSNGHSTASSRLPLIAISGTSGKTSTGWMLARILEKSGREVGAWLSNGVYVDRKLRRDEIHAWELATFAARAREIDVLIQEIPSVLAGGLPENSVGTGIFTSICGSDGQCQRGSAARKEQQAMQTLVAAVGDGRLVANADDLLIVDAVSDHGSNVTYYALNGANPILSDHVNRGGNACWVQNGWVKVQFEGVKRRVMRVDEIPDTLDGHLLFQVQNSLAAIAAALPILGIDIEFPTVFRRDEPRNPAFTAGVQVMSEGSRTILTDQPRSILSVKQIARGIRAFGPRRVIVVVRDLMLRDEEAYEAARVLGSLAGIAVLVEDQFEPDEFDGLKRAMMNTTDPPVIVVRERADATLSSVRAVLEEGDVAVLLTDEPLDPIPVGPLKNEMLNLTW